MLWARLDFFFYYRQWGNPTTAGYISHEKGDLSAEDDDWPTPFQPSERFPDATVFTETETEDKSQEDEVESSSDALSTIRTQLLDEGASNGNLAVSASTSQSLRQRTLANRFHLFHSNEHFRKIFLIETDDAGSQQTAQLTIVSPAEYFRSYISEEVWDTLRKEKAYVEERQVLKFNCRSDENICRHNISDVWS